MKADTDRMSQAVAESLGGAAGGTGDAGSHALIRHYAMLIDRAEQVADDLDAVAAELEHDDPLHDVVARLRAKVEAQAVASDLGPKLLAALTAAGLTVAGRQGQAKGVGDGTGRADTRRAVLDELRARRAAR